jgi:hypothetical protein
MEHSRIGIDESRQRVAAGTGGTQRYMKKRY